MMTPSQYKAAIEKLGLSQEAAGLFFGYSKRQGQRWATKEFPVPPAVDYCLKLMLSTETVPGDLNKNFKLKPEDVK